MVKGKTTPGKHSGNDGTEHLLGPAGKKQCGGISHDEVVSDGTHFSDEKVAAIEENSKISDNSITNSNFSIVNLNNTDHKESKISSPPKKDGFCPTSQEVHNRRATAHRIGGPILTAYGFNCNFSFEAYTYTKEDGSDAFTFHFKQFENGIIKSDLLNGFNLDSIVDRRIPGNGNETKFGNGWKQIVLIRNIKESTPKTRMEGLAILKKFCEDPKYSTYVPKNLATTDATNIENPFPLDYLFKDDKIEYYLKCQFIESELNESFYMKYTDLAKSIWSTEKVYAKFAGTLGYPNYSNV
jgi:hypothetical protein